MPKKKKRGRPKGSSNKVKRGRKPLSGSEKKLKDILVGQRALAREIKKLQKQVSKPVKLTTA